MLYIHAVGGIWSTHLWSWHCGCTWAAACRWYYPSWSRGRLFQDRDLCACYAEREPWHKLRRSQTEPSPLVRRMNLSRSAHGLKENINNTKRCSSWNCAWDYAELTCWIHTCCKKYVHRFSWTSHPFQSHAAFYWLSHCNQDRQSRLKYLNDIIFRTKKAAPPSIKNVRTKQWLLDV